MRHSPMAILQQANVPFSQAATTTRGMRTVNLGQAPQMERESA